MLSRPPLSWSLWSLAPFLLATLIGCQPRIGDQCETSLNCSQSGDRICDRTQPGGYCTMFNCAPPDTKCPDDSVCVAFGAAISDLPECSKASQPSRFERTFCMAPCDKDSDCRSGYSCVDLSSNPNNTVQVDPGKSSKVCLVADAAPSVAGTGGSPFAEPSTDVCKPPVASGGSTSTGAGGASAGGGVSSSGGSSSDGAGGSSGQNADAGSGGD